MVNRAHLNRQVPSEELKRFRRFCEENERDVPEAASQALLDFLPVEFVPEGYDTDGHHIARQLADDLRAMNLLRDSSMKKTSIDNLRGQETEKCHIYVDESLQDALEKYVVENEGKKRGEVGVYFARSLSEYRNGGQTGRIREWYNRLRDNADILPEDRETRTDRITARVREKLDEYSDDYIHKKVIDVIITEETDAEVEGAIREYRRRALDELNLVEVRTSDGVYAPPEQAEEMVADNATDEITPEMYDSLDRDGRVEHLRAALKSRAEARNGSAKMDYDEVIKKVFAGIDGPSHDYAYTLMEEAGAAAGFRYGKHQGRKRLRYNSNWIGEADKITDKTAGENPPSDGHTQDESVEDTTAESDAAAASSIWVAEAANQLLALNASLGDLPEVVVTKKIAEVRWPEEYEVGYSEDLRGRVTDEDRQRVREAVRNGDGTEISPDISDTTPDVEEKLNKHMNATPTAAADTVTDSVPSSGTSDGRTKRESVQSDAEDADTATVTDGGTPNEGSTD